MLKLLDLFCGAGGAARGYADAGFEVVGVDLVPQERYPYAFYQADAMQVLQTLIDGGSWEGYSLHDFAAIHVSPPCQEYSTTKPTRLFSGKTITPHPMLIAPVLELLRKAGVPWVCENVTGAKREMLNSIELCGVSFGLPLLRHRLFLSSELLFAPAHYKHPDGFYNVVGKKVRGHGTFRSKTSYVDRKGRTRIREACHPKAVGQAAMGIDWMTMAEMSQAIPPAYTHWLGMQLLSLLQRQVA